jgi:5'-nucleotidase
VLERITAVPWGRNVLINVNFPNPAPAKGVLVTRQGKHKIGDDLVLRQDPRGRPYLWIGTKRAADVSQAGTDLHAIDAGYVSITPLNVDLTHRETLAELSKVFPAAGGSGA